MYVFCVFFSARLAEIPALAFGVTGGHLTGPHGLGDAHLGFEAHGVTEASVPDHDRESQEVEEVGGEDVAHDPVEAHIGPEKRARHGDQRRTGLLERLDDGE